MHLMNGGLFALLLVIFLIGSFCSLAMAARKRMALWISCFSCMLACVLGCGLGSAALLGISNPVIKFGEFFPGIALGLSIDRLSGFFVLIISMTAFIVAAYSVRFMRMYEKENLGWWGFCLNFFVMAMLLVVTASGAPCFLIAWEIMSLVSYFLVTFNHRNADVRKAGFIYIVMTHFGTVFILSAFILLSMSAGGSFDFTDMKLGAQRLPIASASIIFVFFLIGFGTKAGIVPLHIWLPKAHPAAPANISALMSGVMLKTAIYGFIRIAFDILGAGPIWWGILVFALGAVSALVGVLFAFSENDIKRMLAFSSVENIGIVFLAMGTSLLLLSFGHKAAAGIALVAALFHVFNHAIFKSLLFLCTGSIYYATHIRELDKMGGLIRRMPVTALFFFVAAATISVLPPLAGFAGEYQIYLSMLGLAGVGAGWGPPVVAVAGCTVLALTGALAAGCFIKAFGFAFLALPRSEAAEKAVEVPALMNWILLPLVLLCLLPGLLPGYMMNLLGCCVAPYFGIKAVVNTGTQFIPYFCTVFFGLLALIWLFSALLGGLKVRKSMTWTCGIVPDSGMEYTATSYSQPIVRVYTKFLQPVDKKHVTYKFKPYFAYDIIYENRMGSVFKEKLYRPLREIMIYFSKRWQRIQGGDINAYLSYIFLTLIIVLIFAR